MQNLSNHSFLAEDDSSSFQDGVYLVGWNQKSSQKVAGYFHDILASIAPAGISCTICQQIKTPVPGRIVFFEFLAHKVP